MSQVPPPYNRSFSFTDFSTYNPSLQQPGNKIDQELNNIRVSVNQTIDRLSEIQLDDGRLDSTSLNFNAILTGLSPALSLTYATLNSPVFTGSPEAPTPNQYDNSTKIATTEFVKLQDYATQSQISTLQSQFSGYLPLGGGLMTGAVDFATDGFSDSEIAAWGLGVENNNGYLTTVEATGLRAWDGDNTTGTSVTSSGITFNDGSVQTTAATAGAFLPLAGGTLTGDITFPADLSGNDSQIGPWGLGVENTNGQVAYIQPDVFRIYNSVQTTGTSLDGQGITFNDSTKQVTAALPLTGGSLSGSLEIATDDGVTQLYGGSIGINKDGYAIELFSNSSNSGITFGDASTQTTAGLPLTGGIMSGAIRFDSVGTQNISKGSFDAGRGGYNGISLNCAVDYELNWQAGYLKALNSGGAVVPINLESNLLYSEYGEEGLQSKCELSLGGLNVFNDYGNTNLTLNPYGFNVSTNRGVSLNINVDTGITFPDSTTQNTAGLPLHASTNQTITSYCAGQGDTIFKNYVAIHNYLDIQKSPDPEIDGKLLLTHFGNEEEGILSRMSLDSYGITFPDASTQTTAGLPLTGGTVSGDVYINANLFVSVNPDFDTLWITNEFISFQAGLVTLNNNGISLTGGNGFITFADGSVQTTAFPPAGGTSSQYINGTGALETFPPLGDRYLTTSTSTLTIDNGNGKTMTVGTGLSYSTQQDITVSYDAGHHIHGTIVSYNPTTGVMVFDANSHTGSGTYSNWEVNVGGVNGAILPVDGTAGQVLAKINSTNFNTEWISLGTMSTEPASAYLSTASAVANYLTISNASSTYQTQSGMSAYLSTASAVANYQTISGMSDYLSTSAASSTYLTQSNASSTYLTQSSASANYIGTSAYATTAQAEAMTSATTVLSPARFRDAYFTANVSKPNTSTWLTGTSGTGGLNDSGTWDFRRLEGPTSAANTYVRCDHGTNFGKGRNFNGNIDWTKYNALYFRITQYAGADANSIFRAVLGEASGTNTGDPTVRSVGIRFNGTGAIKILAHNGTTLTTYTTSTSLTTSSSTDILIVSDGSGTVEVFANGTSIGTTTGGPTTLLAGTAQQSGINYRIENNNTPSGTQVKTIISGTTAYIS